MSAYWLNDDSRSFLSRGYLREGQTAEERIREIALTAERILNKEGFAKEFEDCMLKGWISLSSPVWSNFGVSRGLPIACNGSFMEDTMSSILFKVSEIGQMSKQGAGTSVYIGKLRPRGSGISAGGTSFGPVHFMNLIETTTNIVSQSNIRRGSCAAYIDVTHSDILDFLECREEGNSIQHTSLGVCIPDEWINQMLSGDKNKRIIWARILRKRFETGYPYIFFTDNVNRYAPDVYKDKGLKIYASNLCSEIMLHSSDKESFVCNLASLNLLHYLEWKNSDVVRILTWFLDAVMSEYISKIEAMKTSDPRGYLQLESALNFAKNQRAIGIGVLGWHSFLQSKMIPFESMKAKTLNSEIHKFISEKSLQASQEMITLHGFKEPELLKGYGRRHVCLMAIAPTTSSSFILGQVSPSIEPLESNYFIKDLQKGKFTYKNPYLKNILADHSKDNMDTWNSILVKGGSVQHLDFLSQEEKDVFKTFDEISQKEIVYQAYGRQIFIDQGQSLNIKIHPDTPIKEVSDLYLEGWRLGIKAFYYQRSTNPALEFVRSLTECSSCSV